MTMDAFDFFDNAKKLVKRFDEEQDPLKTCMIAREAVELLRKIPEAYNDI